jgi:hypothetical protein
MTDEQETQVAPPRALSVATDARSRGAVRRIRSACGLLAFAIAGLGAWRSGLPPEVAGVRALVAGTLSWLVAWWAAVTAYRHLIRARIRAAIARSHTS